MSISPSPPGRLRQMAWVLPPRTPWANASAFRGRMRLLLDSESGWDRLRSLVATYGCSGKQIHDANLVATALTSGVAKLVTANTTDFRRFATELEIIDLASAA